MQFDYVIVGAGSAGCALAGRLAQDAGISVALIEAGPASGGLPSRIPAGWSKLFKSKVDWNYETQPQTGLDGRRIYWPRGRMLGGCSAMNAQMHIRGAAADFDGWAAAGNPAWSHADLLPHFRASESQHGGADRHHGGDGPLRVARPVDPNPLTLAMLRAGAEIGLPANPDFNGATLDGIGLSPLSQHNGARWSAADAYLTKQPNLTIVTGAQATRVLLEGRRATGVLLRRDGVETPVLAAREVILCGGAVNSPQLLMLSGIGPALDLKRHGIAVTQDLPGVGGNLQDHLVVPVWAGINGNNSLLSAESPVNLMRYMLFRRGMLTSNAAEAAAFLRSRPELPAPDVELVLVPVLFQGQGLVKPTRHGITIGVAGLQPDSRGTIRLASNDPLAKPIIDPNYLGDPRDLEPLRAGVAQALRLLDAQALRGIVADRIGPTAASPGAIDAHIRAHAHTIYHPVGTCRMGRDPLAVVDAELKVHGIDGLRVADASVMPRIVRGHPHAATVAIGERAAALLRAGATTVSARAA